MIQIIKQFLNYSHTCEQVENNEIIFSSINFYPFLWINEIGKDSYLLTTLAVIKLY